MKILNCFCILFCIVAGTQLISLKHKYFQYNIIMSTAQRLNYIEEDAYMANYYVSPIIIPTRGIAANLL